MSEKQLYVFLADGFEEVEALTPVDYCRRAGIKVTTVSISGKKEVTGSHGVPVFADIAGDEAVVSAAWDGICFPGGMPGAKNLAASPLVNACIRRAMAENHLISAICASPALVLAPAGAITGKVFTCYPGMEGEALAAPEAAGARWSPDRVVVDGPLITSRGAGTAGEFAAAIIGRLVDEETARKIAGSVLLTAATA